MKDLGNNKLLYTWQDFEEAKYKFSKAINKKAFNKPVIVGQMRGGMPMAVALSHVFGWPVTTFNDLFHNVNPYNFIVWVDDIICTGETYFMAKEKISKLNCGFKPFVLILNENFPDPNKFCYHKRIEKNKWVIFPWENVEEADLEREKYKNLKGYK